MRVKSRKLKEGPIKVREFFFRISGCLAIWKTGETGKMQGIFFWTGKQGKCREFNRKSGKKLLSIVISEICIFSKFQKSFVQKSGIFFVKIQGKQGI